MSGVPENVTEPASSSRRASRLRAAGTWIFLGVFCLVALMEWHSRRHYQATFAAIGDELSGQASARRAAERGEKPEQRHAMILAQEMVLRFPDAEKLVSGSPGTRVEEHESDRLIEYRWPSLLRSYRLSLRVTRHDRVIGFHQGSIADMRASSVPSTVVSTMPPRPVPAAKAEKVAPKPTLPVLPEPVNTLSEELTQAFTKARELVTNRAIKSDEFHDTLQSVANDLPKIELSTKPHEVVWNPLRIFKDALGFCAFRFSSPLEVPADMYWSFCLNDSSINWYILPVAGRMQGFNSYRFINHASFVDRTAPDCDHTYVQSLKGGQIQPGQEYIIWFARSDPGYVSPAKATLDHTLKALAESTNPGAYNNYVYTLIARVQRERAEGIPLWCAMRLLPANSVPATDSPIQIASHLGVAFHATANSQFVHQSEQGILHTALIPQSQDIAFCDGTSTIRVASLHGQSPHRELTGDAEYSRLAVSPDGKRLAAIGLYSTEITLWDLDRGELMSPTRPVSSGDTSQQLVFGHFSFVGDSQHLFAFRFTPDVFGSDARHDCVLWDIADEKTIRRIEHKSELRSALLTSDGRPLLAIQETTDAPKRSMDGPLELRLQTWNGDNEIIKISLGTGWFPGDIMFSLSPDDKLAGIHASRDSAEYLLVDLEQRAVVNRFNTNFGHDAGLDGVAWSHDAKSLALAQRDGSIRMWNIAGNYRGRVWRGHVQGITSLHFIDEGKFLISASRDGTIRRWSIPDTPCDTFTDSLGTQLVPLCAGEFTMGSPAPDTSETENENERPRHRVQITKPFYLGKYEVTVKEFRTFVEDTGYKTEAEATSRGGFHYKPGDQRGMQSPEYTWRTPGFPQDDDHPVVQVTWNDAQAYCKWLSDRETVKYRLPTEAEWEYACRAGLFREPWNDQNPDYRKRQQDTVGNVADQSLARIFGNYPGAGGYDDGFPWTAPVGKILANGFGLFDMHGNVFEWCQDFYDPEYYRFSPSIDPAGPESGRARVVRGGSFYNHAGCSRSNYRDSNAPDEPNSHIGFRVVREMGDSGS